MNPDKYTFTKEELEILSRAYLDCRLTKLQEKELEIVLLSCSFSSPVIDEARETMAAATTLSSPAPRRRVKRFTAVRWMRWGAAAACFSLVATFAVRMNHGAPACADSSMAVVVYVDGQRLSGEQAMRRAMETQSSCMAMLEKTVSSARAVEMEGMKILNQTIE